MGEEAIPAIDPRFDPRYQRGYAADASDASPSPASPSRPVEPASRVADARPVEAAATSPVAASAEAALDPEAGDAPTPDENAPSAEADHAPSATRWLWIALASCAAFIVTGALLSWNLANDQERFMGSIGTPSEEALRLFATVLSPALVQAGIVGTVIVLAVWVILDRRAEGRRR